MNMKYSLVFIIVLGLLCGCVRQRKADASDTGSIEMTQSETDALTPSHCKVQRAPPIPYKGREMPSIIGKPFSA